MQGLIHYY